MLPPGALAAVGGDVQPPGSGGAEKAATAAGAGAGGDPEVGQDDSLPAAAGDVVLVGLLGFVGAAVGPALLGQARRGGGRGRQASPRARQQVAAPAPNAPGGHVPRPWELHPPGGLGPIGESKSALPSLPSSHRGWARPRDGAGDSGGGSSHDSYSYTYGTGSGSSEAGGSRAAELAGGVGWSSRTSGSGSRRLRRGGAAPKAGSARMRLSAIDDVDDERGGGDADSRAI